MRANPTRTMGAAGLIVALAMVGCGGGGSETTPTPTSTVTVTQSPSEPATETPTTSTSATATEPGNTSTPLTAEQFQAFQVGDVFDGLGVEYSGDPADLYLIVGNADGFQDLKVKVFGLDAAGDRTTGEFTTSTTAVYGPGDSGLVIENGRLNIGPSPVDEELAMQCDAFTTSEAIHSNMADAALESADNVCPYALYTYGSTPVPGEPNSEPVAFPPVLLVADGTGTIVRKLSFNTTSLPLGSDAIFFWGTGSPFVSGGTGETGGMDA